MKAVFNLFLCLSLLFSHTVVLAEGTGDARAITNHQNLTFKEKQSRLLELEYTLEKINHKKELIAEHFKNSEKAEEIKAAKEYLLFAIIKFSIAYLLLSKKSKVGNTAVTPGAIRIIFGIFFGSRAISDLDYYFTNKSDRKFLLELDSMDARQIAALDIMFDTEKESLAKEKQILEDDIMSVLENAKEYVQSSATTGPY